MSPESRDREAVARNEPDEDEVDEMAEAAQRPLVALPDNVATLRSVDLRQKLRMIEALLFAASEPLSEAMLAAHLSEGEDVAALLAALQRSYAERGVNLVRVAGRWAFRTADDLAFLLEKHRIEQRRLSRAGLETLAIIAYHQPVTRAEIEEIRGVSISKGTLDTLLEIGWVRLRGRKRVAGRPLTYGTTEAFLEHFGLESVKDLPGIAELKSMGLLDAAPAGGFGLQPAEDAEPSAEADDEEPLEDDAITPGSAEERPHEDEPSQ